MSIYFGSPDIIKPSASQEAIAERPTDVDAHSANNFRPSENAGPDASQVSSEPTKEASVVGPNEPRQSLVDKIVINGNYTMNWFSSFDLSLLEVISEKYPVEKSEEQHDQSMESRDISVSRDLSGVAAQRTESAVISFGSKTGISVESLEIKAEHAPSHEGALPKSSQPGLPSFEQADEGKNAIPPTNNKTAERNENDAMQVDEADEQLVRDQVVPEADDVALDSETSFQEQVVKGLQRLHARLSQCASLMPRSDQDIASMASEDRGVITFEAVENVSDESGIPSPGPSEQADSIIHTESARQKVESPEVDVREALESGLNGLSAMHRECPTFLG